MSVYDFSARTIEAIKWNFTKFLVDKEGLPVKRYAPVDKPEGLCSDVEAVLRSLDGRRHLGQ